MKKGFIAHGLMAAAALAFTTSMALADKGSNHSATMDQEAKEEAALAALNGGAGPKTVDDCAPFDTEKVYNECKGKVKQ
jgi:hypothetical protein